MKLAADEIELGFLGFVERHVGALEIRARVDELPIEPALIEVVAEVVVVMDVVPGVLQRVRNRERTRQACAPGRRQRRRPRQRLDYGFEPGARSRFNIYDYRLKSAESNRVEVRCPPDLPRDTVARVPIRYRSVPLGRQAT